MQALKPSNLHDQTEKQDMEVCRLESRLMALENEQKKIDAFKRELPLCMQLLCEAIEASKEQLSLHHSLAHKQFKRPIICSFDNRTSDVQSDNAGSEPLVRGKPLNSACAHRNEGEHSAKKHCNYVIGNDAYQWINIWDPRAELSTSYPAGNGSSVTAEKGARLYMSEQAFSSSATPNICSKQKLGGAFAPFSRNSQLVQPTPRPGAINPADLSLKCPESGISMSPTSCRSVQKKAESRDGLELSVCTKSENSKQQVQEVASKERKTESDASDGIQLSRRKTRRSWSPDLHQLFVDALQKLGGAQATPKQIRELMNIEGLTNDEVKSHLQKYRLHTKRLSSSPLTSASQTPPCVVPVPRAWTPLEYASLHSNNTASRQSQSCETFETQENVVELGSSGQLSSLVSRCWVKELPRCSRQHVGNQSGRCFKLSDVGGEESVGEAVKPEIPGLKHHRHPGVELDESDEIEDHSSNYHQTCSFGEDDKDYEDSPKEI